MKIPKKERLKLVQLLNEIIQKSESLSIDCLDFSSGDNKEFNPGGETSFFTLDRVKY